MLRRMWPVDAAEIQRFFAGALTEKEAATVHDALARVHARVQRTTRAAC
jgi:hypothetical protein